ncbi:hypothetical protein KIH87_18695 [Paraneptunicella aestuarii]|uniref:hypothetical protein n=1 Tax=Paraneptunicella aestuarii TaxID=2831148 RepID=UPI001E527BE6|nr:hypothetical protein [Paraneptunicella aestuarii]UAA38662.1 hypothetical protein KIH87_18695 [Paraneptunicella aestuarii]
MLDYAIGFIIGNVWAIAFLLVAVYNFYFRKDHKPTFFLCLVMAGSLGISQTIYTNWILPQDNLVSIYYLYWAAVSCAIALTLFLSTKFGARILLWPLSFAIGLHLIEVLFNIAMHIDRNVIALNQALSVNNDIKSAWWLWNVRDMFILSTNFLVIAASILPLDIFSRVSQRFERRYSCEQMTKVFKRIKSLRQLVNVMPDGIDKSNAEQCLDSAELLLTQWDDEGEDRSHIYSANMLCDRARALALALTPEFEDVTFDEFEKRTVRQKA